MVIRAKKTGVVIARIAIVALILSVLGSCEDELHMGLDEDLEDIIYGDPVELPFFIDEYFTFATHYDLDEILTSSPCDDGLDILPEGYCHQFTFASMDDIFHCIHFQFPEFNWGELPGLPVAPGVVGIRFTAWSDAGWAYTMITAGGTGTSSTNYQDDFEVKENYVITDKPTEYTISLDDIAYERVLGAFAIQVGLVEYTEEGEFNLYLDNIEWINQDD